MGRPINALIYYLAKLDERINNLVFRLVEWRESKEPTFTEEDEEPGINMDQADDPTLSQLTIREISLGDAMVECPMCRKRDDALLVGIALTQDDEDADETETFDISSVGMVAYACGDVVYSACLVNKVAAVLDASENRTLTLDLITNLNKCQEHGVSYTEE